MCGVLVAAAGGLNTGSCGSSGAVQKHAIIGIRQLAEIVPTPSHRGSWRGLHAALLKGLLNYPQNMQ